MYLFGSVTPNSQLYSTHRPNIVRADHAFWSNGRRSFHGMYSEQLPWTQTCRTPRVLPNLVSISHKDWSMWHGNAPDCRSQSPPQVPEEGRQHPAPADPQQHMSVALMHQPLCTTPTSQTLVLTRPAQSSHRAEPHHPVKPAGPRSDPSAAQSCPPPQAAAGL